VQRAVERAVATGCDALQIFTSSPSQWRPRPLPDAEVSAFRAQATAAGIEPIVAHASYLINLASPSPTLRRRSAAALREELHRADRLGLTAVILHPGAHTTTSRENGLQYVAEGLGEVLEGRGTREAALLLEHTAGQGTVLGHRFEELRSILDQLDTAHPVGICLDTCHLVGAGYDIISTDGYRRVFEEFDAIIGLGRLHAFHLNDSKKPLGSRLDRHEHLGRGQIGLEPFRRLVRDERFADVPMLLETPKSAGTATSPVDADPMDLENLALLRAFRLGHRPPRIPRPRT
jgi:deoxyribonuclease-4